MIGESELRRLYINERLSFSKIAKIFHCGDSTIRQNLMRYGIPIRTWSEALKGHPCSDNCKLALSKAKRRLFYDKAFFEEQYLSKQLSCSQIGELIGCDRKTVEYWLKKYGIRIRSLSEALSGERNPHYGKHHSEETKQKLAEFARVNQRGKKRSDECRRKQSITKKGPLNPNWHNGARQERYCFKFNFQLKERVREDFGRRCLLCGAPENGRRLDIHHTDFNKMQGCGSRTWSLVPLCNHCHGRIERNFGWYWFGLMYHHWLINPAINMTLSSGYPFPHIEV